MSTVGAYLWNWKFKVRCACEYNGPPNVYNSFPIIVFSSKFCVGPLDKRFHVKWVFHSSATTFNVEVQSFAHQLLHKVMSRVTSENLSSCHSIPGSPWVPSPGKKKGAARTIPWVRVKRTRTGCMPTASPFPTDGTFHQTNSLLSCRHVNTTLQYTLHLLHPPLWRTLVI